MAKSSITGKDISKSKGYRDFSMSLGLHPVTKDAITVTNENCIKQSVKNLVLTKFGEKLFQPLVGSSVYNLLFEPLDTLIMVEIEKRIRETIANHEPRIKVTELEVLGRRNIKSN